jgi:hypothetical protein
MDYAFPCYPPHAHIAHTHTPSFPGARAQVLLQAAAPVGMRAMLHYPCGAKTPLAYRNAEVELVVVEGSVTLLNPRRGDRLVLQPEGWVSIPPGIPFTLHATKASRVLFICALASPTLHEVCSSDAEVE